nr:MAG TPA: Receptor Binding Protein [Caudoviricetes sp.]
MKWLHGRSSGVFGADGNLSVTANGDMTVSVSDGVGWLANDKADGTVFWNDTKEQTGSELQLTIPLSDAILPRIDRIVVSWDTVDYSEKPRIEVLKGTPNNAPTAPELTNNTLKRQISLARIYVAAAVSSISADSITDERLDPDVCGLVTDWVSVDTTTIQAQFSALLEKVKAELSQLHGGTAMMTKAQYDPAGGGVNICVQEYECTKSGSVYALVGEGAVGRFKVPAAWSAGDTWTVNGVAVPAYCGADAADGDSVVAGRWVLFTFDGSRLDFNGGGGLSASKLAQATAADTDVLTGKKYYAGGKTIRKGKMPNRGSWGATLSPGGVATIPSGFHDGSGQVTAVALKTVTITMATSYGDWVYTLPSGTLVGVSNIAASGNSSEIASLTISGNTVRVTWSYNGVINRQITLIYY